MFILVLCLLVSCTLFESKETMTRELINAELREIDWNTVDAYPLFENCDETAPKALQRECFENVLLSHFQETVNQFEFTVDPQLDSLASVLFVVDTTGTIEILDIEKDSEIRRLMPEFDGIISQSLRNLPPLAPAIKRGIPVRTKFRIPIHLNTHAQIGQ